MPRGGRRPGAGGFSRYGPGTKTTHRRVPPDITSDDIYFLWRAKPILAYWCEQARRHSGPRWDRLKELCAELDAIKEGEK
jgi:hypothetical protein